MTITLSPQHITFLEISHFRNLTALSLPLTPGFNIFYGDNGAGKSSILEALYYLAFGKSFRTATSAKLIQHQKEKFYICARMQDGTVAGMSRSLSGDRDIKLNGEKQEKVSAIATKLPLQFMSPLSYRFFHDGAKVRRKYLDWAVFHVKPFFLNEWQVFQRLLKQRNEALKQKETTLPWDSELAHSAEVLDQARTAIFFQLEPLCVEQLHILLPQYIFQLRYQRGWPFSHTFLSVIAAQKHRDQHLGYTYYGPQRADFQLLCNSTPLQDILSQGQQKLAAYALQLALGNLLKQASQKQPIYLVDDLPSELDDMNREKVFTALQNLNAQTFITGITREQFKQSTNKKNDQENNQMFHVEQGHIAVANNETML